MAPWLRHATATAGFRYKSSEELYVDRKIMDVIGSNEESDNLSSNVVRVGDGDFAGSDDEIDVSDDESSSQDFLIDKVSGPSCDRDKTRVNVLNYPWLNGVEVPGKVVKNSIPGPIKYARTKKETFFQFDYRNVDRVPITRPEMEDLLQKIELMLKNTRREPYGSSRGVATLRKNIDALPDDAKVPVGGGKGSSTKVGDGYDKAIFVTSHAALRKALLNLLYERHAIITSGWTHNIKKLSAQVLGQSLLGPETRVVMDHQISRDVIGELWMRGVSSKYNRLIKRHEERSVERNFLRYLKPRTKEEVAKMDWDTDLMLNSNEELARRKPSPITRGWRQ